MYIGKIKLFFGGQLADGRAPSTPIRKVIVEGENKSKIKVFYLQFQHQRHLWFFGIIFFFIFLLYSPKRIAHFCNVLTCPLDCPLIYEAHNLNNKFVVRVAVFFFVSKVNLLDLRVASALEVIRLGLPFGMTAGRNYSIKNKARHS